MIATIVSPAVGNEDRSSTEAYSVNREVSSLNREKPADDLARKYIVQRTDGEPVDPNARYLVLRLDTDPFARKAAEVYAASVSGRHPALAASVLKACASTVKLDWKLPVVPRCACGSECRPIAFERSGKWSLEWECLGCCEPVVEPAIEWPFNEGFAKGSDFERIGIGWDCD